MYWWKIIGACLGSTGSSTIVYGDWPSDYHFVNVMYIENFDEDSLFDSNSTGMLQETLPLPARTLHEVIMHI